MQLIWTHLADIVLRVDFTSRGTRLDVVSVHTTVTPTQRRQTTWRVRSCDCWDPFKFPSGREDKFFILRLPVWDKKLTKDEYFFSYCVKTAEWRRWFQPPLSSRPVTGARWTGPSSLSSLDLYWPAGSNTIYNNKDCVCVCVCVCVWAVIVYDQQWSDRERWLPWPHQTAADCQPSITAHLPT